jgi:hypothetical protein
MSRKFSIYKPFSGESEDPQIESEYLQNQPGGLNLDETCNNDPRFFGGTSRKDAINENGYCSRKNRHQEYYKQDQFARGCLRFFRGQKAWEQFSPDVVKKDNQ